MVFLFATDTKAHTRDPKSTVLDPNDPKAKQTHIPKAESFEEYMKRRASGAIKNAAPISPAAYSAPAGSAKSTGGKAITFHMHPSLITAYGRILLRPIFS